MIKLVSAKRNSLPTLSFFIGIFLLGIVTAGYGQITPFQKSVLDSLKAHEFNVSIALALNASKDGSSSLTSGSDIGLMYATQRSNYELMQSSYFNRLAGYTGSDRFIAMLQCSLFSHDTLAGKLIEKQFYPEPFLLYQNDQSRAINYRWQFGANAVYAFKPTKLLRMKMGVGILYEKESWQMIKKEQLPYLDTFPQSLQKYIFDTIGITREGKLFRNNVRANIYANFICSFTKTVSLNAFFDIQLPFVPPYHDLPQTSVFPVVTKRYPRITTNCQLTFKIWEKLDFVTGFSLQYDQGQIPLYVPNFVYNLSEGLQISF